MKPTLPRGLVVVVLIAGSALFVPRVLFGIGHFDEGFIASGAMLMLRGELPYRDFYVIYGPGQYALTATLFSLFGEDLLVSRLAHVLILAALGVCVAVCSARMCSGRPRWVWLTTLAFVLLTGYAMPNPGYPAALATVLLLGSALAFSAHHGSARALAGASLLLGLATLQRWDFGLFGFMAEMLALAVVLLACRAPLASTVRHAALAVLPGALLALAVLVPLLWLGGAVRWFQEVPIFLFLEFRTWRNLELLAPGLHSLQQAWAASNALSLARTGAELALVGLPFVLGPAAVGIAAVRLSRQRAPGAPPDVLALVVGLFTIFLLNQMRVRPGLTQGYPSFVTALALSGYVASACPWPQRLDLAARRVGAALVVALALLLGFEIQDDLRRIAAGSRPALDIPRAAYTLAPTPRQLPGMLDYAALVRHVRQATRKDEAIFSGVGDTSRLFANDAMLYFLADRPAATRWVEMEPGLSNTAQGQAELIDALESRHVDLLVLWHLVSNEPNATSRSNGVHLLDDYIAANFVENARFGNYKVMVRKGSVQTRLP